MAEEKRSAVLDSLDREIGLTVTGGRELRGYWSSSFGIVRICCSWLPRNSTPTLLWLFSPMRIRYSEFGAIINKRNVQQRRSWSVFRVRQL